MTNIYRNWPSWTKVISCFEETKVPAANPKRRKWGSGSPNHIKIKKVLQNTLFMRVTINSYTLLVSNTIGASIMLPLILFLRGLNSYVPFGETPYLHYELKVVIIQDVEATCDLLCGTSRKNAYACPSLYIHIYR